jgi:TonB family protein
MAIPSDHGHFLTPGRRLGLGVTLSAALHLAGLAALAALATRAGRATFTYDLEGWDTVEISDVGEAPAGPLPATPAASGPKAMTEAAPPAAEPTRPAPTRPGGHATRPEPHAVRRPRPRVATTPASPALVPAPSAAPAPPAQGSGKAASVVPEAHPGAAIDVGGRGEKIERVVDSDGHSALALFRADLKRRLRAAWRPIEIYQRLDPQGQLEGSRLITVVQVRLRADGTAERIAVNDSSGFAALDDEAQAALRRVLPLPRLAGEIVDDKGGFDVRCAFHLDVGLYRFAQDMRHAIAKVWHPSKAFLATGDKERKTVLRLTLTREGGLTKTTVMASAGIDFLDARAQAALQPGTQLPPPPPGFFRKPGPVSVVVAFHHGAGELHILLPREVLEEDE